MQNQWMNLLGVLTVSLAWGLGGPVSYVVTRSLTATETTFGRCGIAFLGLLPFLFLDGRRFFQALSTRGRILLAASGITLGIHFTFFALGVAHSSLSTAVMLIAVEPALILAVGMIAFREKLTWEGALASLFCILGIGVISILPHWGQTEAGAGAVTERGAGDLAAVAAVLTYALYYGLNRSFRAEEQKLASLQPGPLRRGFGLASIIYFFTAATTGLILLVFRPLEPVPATPITTAAIAGVIALGFLPTIVGHTLSQIVSRRAHPLWVSLMSPGETVMSLFIGFLFLNQSVTRFEIAGGILIAIGVGIAIHSEANPNKTTAN